MTANMLADCFDQVKMRSYQLDMQVGVAETFCVINQKSMPPDHVSTVEQHHVKTQTSSAHQTALLKTGLPAMSSALDI